MVNEGSADSKAARPRMRAPALCACVAALAVLLLLPTGAARGEATDVSLAGLELPDQHGQLHKLAPDTRTVIFAADMNATKIAHALLAARDPDYLNRHHAVLIADIHRMPRVITRLFALPKMRKYPYRMLLVHEAEQGRAFPRREGEVTILRLADLRIASVAYVTSAAALEAALAGPIADAGVPRAVISAACSHRRA